VQTALFKDPARTAQ